MKTALKWLLGIIIINIVLILTIPFIFKDKVKTLVLEEANKNINAELTIEDIHLSLLRSFPKLTIQIENTKILGKGIFSDETLLSIKNINAEIRLSDIIYGNQISIKSFEVSDAKINIKVLKNGDANYNITHESNAPKSEEATTNASNFSLAIEKYSFRNINLSYDDLSTNLHANITNLHHRGSAVISSKEILLQTGTTIEKLTTQLDKIKYLNNVQTKLEANLAIGLVNGGYEIKILENKLTLNKLIVHANGNYFFSNEFQKMNIKLAASNTAFKELLSLIPSFYKTGYETMIADGNISLVGIVEGKLTENTYPSFDFHLGVENGSIEYPELPKKITGINLATNVLFPGGTDLNKTKIAVNTIEANFDKNKFTGDFILSKPMTDMHLIADLVGKIDLGTLQNFLPIEVGNYTGIVDADAHFNGNLNDILNDHYEQFTASGKVKISAMQYQSDALPKIVQLDEVLMSFTPKKLLLEKFEATMGTSNFSAKGVVNNYIAYALKDQNLQGTFNLKSSKINLNELLPTTDSTATKNNSSKSESTVPTIIPANINIIVNAKIDTLLYDGLFVKNTQGTIKIKEEIASFSKINMLTLGGEVCLNGAFDTQNHNIPKINFDYRLSNIDINALGKAFNSIQKLTPIVEKVEGKISSTLHFETDLTPTLDPVLEKINAKGNIASKSIKLNDLKVLNELRKITSQDNLSAQHLKNFKASFAVSEGKLTVAPFTVKLSGMLIEIAGYNTLDKTMNYNFKLAIPKNKLPGNLTQEIEKQISKVNGLGNFINLNSLPENIPLTITAKGPISNPNFSTDYTDAMALLTKNISKNIRNFFKGIVPNSSQKASQKKQQNTTTITAEAKAKEIKATASQKATMLREEAKKQGAVLIEKAGNNFIQKNLAKEAAKQIEREANLQAKKIESAAEKKAAEILAKAN